MKWVATLTSTIIHVKILLFYHICAENIMFVQTSAIHVQYFHSTTIIGLLQETLYHIVASLLYFASALYLLIHLTNKRYSGQYYVAKTAASVSTQVHESSGVVCTRWRGNVLILEVWDSVDNLLHDIWFKMKQHKKVINWSGRIYPSTFYYDLTQHWNICTIPSK